MYRDPSYEDKFYDRNRLDMGKQPNGKIVNIDPFDGGIIVEFFDEKESDYVSYDSIEYIQYWDDTRMGGMYYIE